MDNKPGKKVNVIHDQKAIVPVEVLAKDIRAIAAGIRALRKGPLRDSTLCMLIDRSIRSSDRPGEKVIAAVLEGIENLEATHLKRVAG